MRVPAEGPPPRSRSRWSRAERPRASRARPAPCTGLARHPDRVPLPKGLDVPTPHRQRPPCGRRPPASRAGPGPISSRRRDPRHRRTGRSTALGMVLVVERVEGRGETGGEVGPAGTDVARPECLERRRPRPRGSRSRGSGAPLDPRTPRRRRGRPRPRPSAGPGSRPPRRRRPAGWARRRWPPCSGSRPRRARRHDPEGAGAHRPVPTEAGPAPRSGRPNPSATTPDLHRKGARAAPTAPIPVRAEHGRAPPGAAQSGARARSQRKSVRAKCKVETVHPQGSRRNRPAESQRSNARSPSADAAQIAYSSRYRVRISPRTGLFSRVLIVAKTRSRASASVAAKPARRRPRPACASSARSGPSRVRPRSRLAVRHPAFADGDRVHGDAQLARRSRRPRAGRPASGRPGRSGRRSGGSRPSSSGRAP